MDDSQKERLEQELKFLKESFEAEVISKEEFEKGKGRIERKLKEISKLEQKSKEPKPEEQKEEETKEKASPIISKEGETIKLKVIQDEAEPDHHQHSEPVQIKSIEEKTQIQEQKTDEKGSKFFKYSVAFVVLLLASFFLYSIFKDKEAMPKAVEVKESRINVLVLNDKKNCFNCDTQRVLGILESWFGDLNVGEIDYNTDEGKSLALKFDASLLPFYILDENVTKKESFAQFRQVFIKRNSSYVLSENTAGSTFYFKRESVSNRLDLFVKPEDESSIKAEKNLEEFLSEFDIKFEKHLPTDNLTKALDIKTFPTFLVNNRVKFAGVHSADTIKGNFCKLNKVPECGKSLSKNLA